MPPKARSKARAFKIISSILKSITSNSAEPPTPFKRAPATLEPFLSKLDTSHIYITHIDTKPKDFKIKIIGPFHMKICFSLMGILSETTVNILRMFFNNAFLARSWLQTTGGYYAKKQKIGSCNIRYREEGRGSYLDVKDWDLDWRFIIIATKIIDEKALFDFEWMIIKTVAVSDSATEEEGRRKIVVFKDELIALEKENLFFKWIKLRQIETIVKAKDMFETQGVDFDKFWAKVGGMEGMPGIDQI
ncbi:hypothetical protein BKA64DRAFT_698223 [Cadophora sp. MPI-SDFR-AT-0126]|nr:hypothetical protein BKA64DRAFT_698223 [Leotiomycetes sp. MPI-SDFR-AT-0126]